jgi:hypothetical protein
MKFPFVSRERLEAKELDFLEERAETLRLRAQLLELTRELAEAKAAARSSSTNDQDAAASVDGPTAFDRLERRYDKAHPKGTRPNSLYRARA